MDSRLQAPSEGRMRALNIHEHIHKSIRVHWDARGAGHGFQHTYLTENARWQLMGEFCSSLSLRVVPGVNAPLTPAGGMFLGSKVNQISSTWLRQGSKVAFLHVCLRKRVNVWPNKLRAVKSAHVAHSQFCICLQTRELFSLACK